MKSRAEIGTRYMYLVPIFIALLLGSAVWAESTPPPALSQETAGEIFGVPVSLQNYFFARSVALLFPRPWGAADVPTSEEREKIIWENLILHYESFRQGVKAADEELDKMADELLRTQNQPFTRKSDPQKYTQWIKETLKMETQAFENQLEYLIQIKKLKEQMLKSFQVSVTEKEMQEEFLNEKHHLAGEIVTFKTKSQAQKFYEKHKKLPQWKAMKAAGKHKVRPVSMMTFEAYVDLWSIPKEQLAAFHAQEIGSISSPMPFGTEWCVYRLTDKRVGDLKDFPQERDAFHYQVTMKKKYGALKQWVESLKKQADLKIFIKLPEGA